MSDTTKSAVLRYEEMPPPKTRGNQYDLEATLTRDFGADPGDDIIEIHATSLAARRLSSGRFSNQRERPPIIPLNTEPPPVAPRPFEPEALRTAFAHPRGNK